MPLVVPGINTSMGDKSEWINKLMGKTISDTSNETNFAKKDLPECHRVLKPDDMKTMDHNPNRLNVHVDGEGAVRDVNFG
ncbi:Proteinase inhibitor I78 [Penicillium paradoxum]|uniref:Proteinase inhibitor I78 n=1 Tax=Penicillium paradoxum TaxID=176176 RepID=UPI0025482E06|nr:Proteinase inhibitor I78 [Penicillium paradoxum]KAJ5794218.1 Proteinase inhibitor I78 [Penicillium paradoxum]